jgi:DNA-binding transcriptional regulator YiaG
MATKRPTPDQVRAARLKLGLTQVQLAAVLYVTERQVRKYETGVTVMPLLAWEKVQAAL